jgi:hypothetical protein
MSCFFELRRIVKVLKSDYNNEGENKARTEMQNHIVLVLFPFIIIRPRGSICFSKTY